MILEGIKNFCNDNFKVNALVVIISLAILSFIVTPESNRTVLAEENNISVEEARPMEIIMESENSSQEILCAMKEVEEVELSITLASKEYKGCITQPVTIKPNKLWRAYTNAPTDMTFDYKQKANVINVLWEFLVNEQNVDPILACAIIGNMSQEGYFGQGQGDNPDLSSIENARHRLGGGTCGFGIIQWTTAGRQKLLLSYYEDAYAQLSTCELDGDLWEITKIVAECACLLEEMKVYGVFDDYYNYLTDDCSIEDLIESACGLTSVNYIAYKGSSSQWMNTGESYILAANHSNGACRLDYALNVYNYFN